MRSTTICDWKCLLYFCVLIIQSQMVAFSSIVLCCCENQGKEPVNGLPFLHPFALNNKYDLIDDCCPVPYTSFPVQPEMKVRNSTTIIN